MFGLCRSTPTSRATEVVGAARAGVVGAAGADVTREDVIAVQNAWAGAIKKISRIYIENGDYVQAAATAAGELYAYGKYEVLFKPTKAAQHQFRPKAEDAMSYFVGCKAVEHGYAEDGGFAINGGMGWSDCVYDNHQIDLNCHVAIAMGNYYFTCATTGEKPKVEYTFGYQRCDDGKVRIFLHHSSVPYDVSGKAADPRGHLAASTAAVTREDVIAVQKAWAGAIKQISRIYMENGDYVQAAATAAGELYAYGKYDVLFKPAKAAQHQFRPKAEDAMSYFVGCKSVEHGCAEDGGFAINGGKGWSDCVCDNHQITLNIDVAIAMGNYYFTCATTGEKSKVEYTFGYKRCDDGKVRIFLHHSSVPYDVSGKAADPKGHLAASVAAVTREDVIAVQNAWAGAIKHISRIYMENGDYVQAAATAAGELYAYGKYDVLFKPTKAAQHQFRPKAEDAMSYFVGCKSVEHGYAEDGGFAINGGMGWSDCVYDNHQIDLNCHVAIAMGNYYFTCATTGEKSKVEYTFGYQRCDDGKVRIFLHHSSVPYDVSGKAADPRGHLAASTAAVTREDAIAVQNAWAGAIKNISRIYMENGDYVQAAATAAGELYAYGKYDVLFKPTKAAQHQFRPKAEDAMSYFVGCKAVEHGYAEDGGFAINGDRCRHRHGQLLLHLRNNWREIQSRVHLWLPTLRRRQGAHLLAPFVRAVRRLR
ncbi:unnamed protein product [Prorocentrum cordatum]|uniref:Rieske domain-containing protein n=1 Tax=Prorocentrum cordatum TaxID=2364126 RepID=A0ABN9WY65_9DINO|nr:unnamed protein product [Polarella glacialis]